MATGYRFGDVYVGSDHNAFRTYNDCEEFLKDQLSSGESEKVYKIEGTLVSDDGGRDGLVIKVSSYSHYRTVYG